jgi:hypothetical protein
MKGPFLTFCANSNILHQLRSKVEALKELTGNKQRNPFWREKDTRRKLKMAASLSRDNDFGSDEGYSEDDRRDDERIQSWYFDPVLQDFPESPRLLKGSVYDVSSLLGMRKQSLTLVQELKSKHRRVRILARQVTKEYDPATYARHPVLQNHYISLHSLNHSILTNLTHAERAAFEADMRTYQRRSKQREHNENLRRLGKSSSTQTTSKLKTSSFAPRPSSSRGRPDPPGLYWGARHFNPRVAPA